MEYTNRIQRLRRSMTQKKIDALLIGRPENRRYLSGYNGGDHGIAESAGFLLICRSGLNFLLTDFRFTEQAENETEGFEILLYPKGLFALLRQLLPKLSIRRLAFESEYTLHSSASVLAEICKKK